MDNKSPSTNVAETTDRGCSICGAPFAELEDYSGPHRLCKRCGSVERQRVFADLYRNQLKNTCDLTGKRVLVVATMASELRFLKDIGVGEIVTADARPEAKADLTIDVCNMPQVETGSFDAVFASYVLTCVYDLDLALSEFARVLRPGGVLFASDPLTTGAKTEEIDDPDRITHWYGKEAYEKFRVGHYRRFGDLDTADLIGKKFDVEAITAVDAPTGATVVWHVGRKPMSKPAEKQSESRQATPPVEKPRIGGSLAADVSGIRLTVIGCPVCGNSMREGFSATRDNDVCPTCRSVARQRTLRPIIANIVEPLIPKGIRHGKPLLCFGMDPGERTLLEPAFKAFKSVSLYGRYWSDHEEGVDARNLSRYKDEQFCGTFGICYFDYFYDQEQGLREAYRVTAPGGVVLILIAPYRLLEGRVPPVVTETLTPRPGYFDYAPPGTTIPHVKVGREYFVEAMRTVGFDADRVPVWDQATGQSFDWFIGVKPAKFAEKSGWLATPAVQGPRVTMPAAKQFSTPLDPPVAGFRRVSATLTMPSIPAAAADAKFAHHGFDTQNQAPTRHVYGVQKGGILVSDDLGKRWHYVPTPKTGDARLHHAFRMSDGNVLLQSASPHRPDELRDSPELRASLFVCDKDLNVIEEIRPGRSNWHGSRSIDEAGGTIVYSEYPENSTKYRKDFAERKSELVHLCDNAAVFRSTDGGRSWAKVFEQSWEKIRHFHTAVADPFEPKVWYVSSGDTPDECHIWRSTDDGVSWNDVTGDVSHLTLHPTVFGRNTSIYRHTDMIVLPDRVIWGSDDLLGRPSEYRDPKATMTNRVGSRVFMSPKTTPLQPQCIGFVGSHIRSIIDVGPGYILLTEAKRTEAVSRPQVCLLSKTEPYTVTELFTLDRYLPTGTGFTYSRNSRAAIDGRFFTYRDRNDVFGGGPPILQWDIAFE